MSYHRNAIQNHNMEIGNKPLETVAKLNYLGVTLNKWRFLNRNFVYRQDRHLVSNLQPGGPGPCIYIFREQCGPVLTPGNLFPFHRLLRLSGLRWRYSNPPPHGLNQLGQSQSQNYFTTGGLPPISSSWRRAP
jgi:hypothetical protein